MKTISVQADGTAEFDALAFRRANSLVQGPSLGLPLRAKVPTWLPAPVTPPVGRSARRPTGNKRKISSNIWLAPEREPPGEKIMMGTLVASAAAGIAYGFLMLINLVEHWAVFQTTVAQALK